MKFKHKRLALGILSLAIVLGIIGGYTYKAYAPTGDVILVRTASGGLCSTPSGGEICHSETKLYANGDFGDKHLSHDQVQKLRELIAQTDFSIYTPSSGSQCPSALDGSDVGYIFPIANLDEQYTPCQLNIPANDPLFSYLATL